MGRIFLLLFFLGRYEHFFCVFRNNLELRDSDGNVEMIAGFKKVTAEFLLVLCA